MSRVYKRVKAFKTKYPKTVAFRLEKHSKVAEKVLDKDERILYAFASGRKTYVYIFTDKKFIRARKNILWGDYIDTFNYGMLKGPNISPLENIEISKGLIWNNLQIDWFNDNWCLVKGLDPSSVNEITNSIYKSVNYVNNKSRITSTKLKEEQPVKYTSLDYSKSIQSDDELLRLSYYRGVHKLLTKEYENCKTSEERQIVLEKMKVNLEAYKKDKESQMKLTLK